LSAITETKRGRTPDPRVCRIHLPSSKVARPPGSQSGHSPAELEDRGICCVVCGTEVTRQQQAMAVNGRHEHAFFNPAGVAFEIRCFRQAPGTVPQGEPTAEFTWFAGYHWQVALCSVCHAHLGWRFTNEGAFYGLIGTRLI
jgi:hypothetical protein